MLACASVDSRQRGLFHPHRDHPSPNAPLPAPARPSPQLGAQLCDGSAASASFDLASLAPQVEGLLSGGLSGVASQLDGLLGTGSAIQNLLGGLANGTLTDPDQFGPALDSVLSALLTSPTGNTVAGWLSDALTALQGWLGTPIEPVSNVTAPATGGNATDGPREPGAGAGGDDPLGTALGAIGSILGDVLGGLGDAVGLGDNASGALEGIQGLVGQVLGAVTGGNPNNTTPGERAGAERGAGAVFFSLRRPCFPQPALLSTPALPLLLPASRAQAT